MSKATIDKLLSQVAELKHVTEAQAELLAAAGVERDELKAQIQQLQQSLLKCADLVNFDGGEAIDWLIDNHHDLRRLAKGGKK